MPAKSKLTPVQKLAKKLSADAIAILRAAEKSIVRIELGSVTGIEGRQFAPALRRLVNNQLLSVSGDATDLTNLKYKRTATGTQVLKALDKAASAAA